MEPKYTEYQKKRASLRGRLYPILSYFPERCASIKISSWINTSTKSQNRRISGWVAAVFLTSTQAKERPLWRLISSLDFA